MTREDVARTLRQMERLREATFEAPSEADEARMCAEYGRLWATIAPYVTGATPYTESSAPNPDAERAAWNSGL